MFDYQRRKYMYIFILEIIVPFSKIFLQRKGILFKMYTNVGKIHKMGLLKFNTTSRTQSLTSSIKSLRFSIFHHRFFWTKYPLLTPQITTFPGVDFGKQFNYSKEHPLSFWIVIKLHFIRQKLLHIWDFPFFSDFYLLENQF